ncbi:MAG: hypothetical protein KME44_09065 [Candidatus Thiodiazotropha sp. (ex Lucina pensylvanica)]|nr:hypothetical protein [Candidatus Thiodiazotropha sp. (ex Lucina pensylvanica)]
MSDERCIKWLNDCRNRGEGLQQAVMKACQQMLELETLAHSFRLYQQDFVLRANS